jgi:hypothetical protein
MTLPPAPTADAATDTATDDTAEDAQEEMPSTLVTRMRGEHGCYAYCISEAMVIARAWPHLVGPCSNWETVHAAVLTAFPDHPITYTHPGEFWEFVSTLRIVLIETTQQEAVS